MSSTCGCTRAANAGPAIVPERSADDLADPRPQRDPEAAGAPVFVAATARNFRAPYGLASTVTGEPGACARKRPAEDEPVAVDHRAAARVERDLPGPALADAVAGDDRVLRAGADGERQLREAREAERRVRDPRSAPRSGR